MFITLSGFTFPLDAQWWAIFKMEEFAAPLLNRKRKGFKLMTLSFWMSTDRWCLEYVLQILHKSDRYFHRGWNGIVMSGKCQVYTSSLVKSNNETIFSSFLLCTNIVPRHNDDVDDNDRALSANYVRGKISSSNRYRQNNPFAFVLMRATRMRTRKWLWDNNRPSFHSRRENSSSAIISFLPKGRQTQSINVQVLSGFLFASEKFDLLDNKYVNLLYCQPPSFRLLTFQPELLDHQCLRACDSENSSLAQVPWI